MKAVADNITESWLCVDCGVNTAPGMPDGPTVRVQLALGGKSPQSVGSDAEVYMVKRGIWIKAGMGRDHGWCGCLCIGCLEDRLGRKLEPKDFVPDHPFNRMPGTPRLLDRRTSKWTP
jgi:hypothetical protein